MAEWFQDKIMRFLESPESDTREAIITEMKEKFACYDEEQRADIVRNLELEPWLVILGSLDKLETEQVCDALTVMNHASEPGDILFRYANFMTALLKHEHDIVKIYALSEMLCAASNEESLRQLLSKSDMVIAVAETLADGRLAVAQLAMDILKKVGEHPNGIKLLFSGQLLRAMAKVLESGDNAKFRLYEVVVDIAASSDAGLKAAVNSGFLHSLAKTLDTDDTLLQLNTLQTMTDLATTQGGLDFLESQGTVQKLADMILKSHETPLTALLIPGLMRFFGHVARLHPQQVFSKYPQVVNALFEVIDSDDDITVAIALNTFSHIGSTVQGKYVLEDVKQMTISGLKKLGKVIQAKPTKPRISALNDLALILHVDKSEQDEKIRAITKSWFDWLDDEPLKMIVSLCKQPFADIREASLQVLAEVANLPWGQQYIAKYPGLIEFLLDRNVESFKQCKDAKFTVVKNLSTSTDVFDAETIDKIKIFVKQGAFHVDVLTEVALEGAS